MARRTAKTVFVAGARRGAGKTMVSAFLLRSLPGTGAVKITCCRTALPCPRGKPCGVCGALSSPFAVIRDHEILATPGKDTARLLEAATGRVVWLQSREEALADGLAAALSIFDEERAVIVEGNAAFQASVPDLGLLVIGPGSQAAKPTVNVALPHITGVVLNAQPGEPPPIIVPGLPEGVRTFRFDVAMPDASPEASALVQWVAEALNLQVRSVSAGVRCTS